MKSTFHVEILRKSKNQVKKILESDKWYFSIVFVLSILMMWLNSENIMMGGILPYYEDFAKYFQSGLSNDSIPRSPLFPMWGYGIIYAIFKNYFIIGCLQMAFMLFTIYKIETIILSIKTINYNKYVFRGLVVLGLNWFLFHTPYWPYSISANCLVLGLYLLLRAIYNSKMIDVVLSSIMIGVMLNLRSDYIYYCIYLSFYLIFLSIIKKFEWKNSLLWIIIWVTMMLPWSFHSKNISGHHSFTSMNSGHVLFISLGQLQGNVWGITDTDEDPKMHALIDSLGSSEASTYNYEGNKILIQEWKNRIVSHPSEYLRKCVSVLYMTLTRPFCHGEIYKKFIKDEAQIETLKNNLKRDIASFDIIALLSKFVSKTYMGFIIPLALNLLSIALFIFFLFIILKGILKNKWDIFKESSFHILYSVIAYQIALQTLAYYNPNYHSNVYLFYALLAALILYKPAQKPIA